MSVLRRGLTEPLASPPRGTLLTLAILTLACGENPLVLGSGGDDPTDRVSELVFVSGAGQEILGGRRSPQAFGVQARTASGEPLVGVQVEFALVGGVGGTLSQPRALTDSGGVAETYLLQSRSGSGLLRAVAGAATAEVALSVIRAPGSMEVEAASGAIGLPGKTHPDSLVRVRVRDSEGLPMAGVEVWFVGPAEVSQINDTTDAEGWATTVVRQAHLRSGPGQVVAFILAFPELTVAAPRPVEGAADRVVLVSIDGLRADAIGGLAPPTLVRLAAEGALSTTAQTVSPSLTSPAHLSLLASVPPEGHGIFGEDIAFTAEMAGLEPLFRTLDREGLDAQAYMAREGPLEGLETALQCRIAFGLDSLELIPPGAANIAEAVAPVLADPEVELVFVHLPDPDQAGHAHGWSTPEYAAAVMAADSALGRIADALTPQTLLVVTSDHGGGGAFGDRLHGSEAPEDSRIPILLWGPRVVAGFDPGEISILDLAPTVLWAFGLEPPLQYEGRSLREAFR